MYLNKNYYIEEKSKRKQLMEMIDMTNSNSEFMRWQNEFGKLKKEEGRKEGKEEGRKEGREEIISKLLNFMNPKEISEKTNIPLSKINKIEKIKSY